MRKPPAASGGLETSGKIDDECLLLRDPPSRKSPSLVPSLASIAIGDQLVCQAETGVFRPCSYCGSETFIVGPGVGQHAAQLRCASCDRGGRWLAGCYLREAAS
jgi:hypothetical protein